jgi:hypothetical protein
LALLNKDIANLSESINFEVHIDPKKLLNKTMMQTKKAEVKIKEGMNGQT